MLCNPVSTDRSGVAASRFFVAAGACVIRVRFAAESRTSHCNGSVRAANGALAADFFRFWQRSPKPGSPRYCKPEK